MSTLPRFNAIFMPLCALLVGCSKPSPPAPVPVQREATPVHASLGRTWDAVIAHFAAHSVPIATIDRSSGLIVTDRMFVSPDDAYQWGWCGWWWDDAAPKGQHWKINGPSSGSYNVLVRGDSTSSTIRITARWTLEGRECVSRDVYERNLESAIIERATVKVP